MMLFLFYGDLLLFLPWSFSIYFFVGVILPMLCHVHSYYNYDSYVCLYFSLEALRRCMWYHCSICDINLAIYYGLTLT